MVLRLSVNSYHYKTVKYVMGTDYFLYRLSLCRYFWTFILCSLGMPFIALTRGIIKVTYNIRLPEVHWPTVEWPEVKRGNLIRKIILTGINSAFVITEIILHAWFWAALLISATIFLWFGRWILDMIDDWDGSRFHKPKKEKIPKPKKPREPNLTIEYLKAKKGKFCPYIVWEDR